MKTVIVLLLLGLSVVEAFPPQISEEQEIARPDKRATHALVFQGIDGLTLRGVEVDWDRETPEPKRGAHWCSATFPIPNSRASMAWPLDQKARYPRF